VIDSRPADSTGSSLWRLAFRIAYRLLRIIDPLIRLAWRAGLPGLGSTVDLVVTGRRSGRERRTLLTLLSIDDTWYVGHPNGPCAWTRNLDTASEAHLQTPNGEASQVVATRITDAAERSRVISLTPALQPFPGNILYGLAQRHIQAVGVYFRLERRARLAGSRSAPQA
jgi:hypothetical protein